MPAMPIPVSVLTGFLGAGKTTLLNRLLGAPELADTAVIINEFGDVAIDHLLVEQSTDGVIELSGGCLCCSVRGDLVETLAGLVDRLQTGRIAALKRVVIETTGLADPAPVLQAVMAHPVLVQAYRLDGVVTLVDAVNGCSVLDGHVEAVRQVAVADRLVITKTDLAGEAAVRLLEARLRRLNPSAALLRSPAASPGALLDAGLYDPSTKSADVRRWLGRPAAPGYHDHPQGEHGHGHVHGTDAGRRHDSRILPLSLVHDRPLPFAAIEAFLDLLRSSLGERLLRMKGVFELAEDPERPLVVHGVQSILHPPVFLPAWPDGVRGTRLVLIMLDVDADHVRRMFDAVTGRPSVDQPDRAALLDNPLSIAGFG